MPNRPISTIDRSQQGGVTILVALMLLVLLTLAAIGMSRNSFREIVASGTIRQGSMARNTADSGLEWSIYWMDLTNLPGATGNAKKLADLKQTLLLDKTKAGVAKDVSDSTGATDYVPGANPVLTMPSVGDTTQTVSIGLTSMGKLPITGMSEGVGAGAFKPASGAISEVQPDLWAVRSDAQVTVGGVTFIHAREAWISTPIQ